VTARADAWGGTAASAVWFAAKAGLGANVEGHRPVAAASAGALAVCVHDCIMCPWDVVKQRLQLGYYRTLRPVPVERGCGPVNKLTVPRLGGPVAAGHSGGVWDSIRTVAKTEGVGAFFVAYPTTLLMNVPYHGVMVAANESLKKLLSGPTVGTVRCAR